MRFLSRDYFTAEGEKKRLCGRGKVRVTSIVVKLAGERKKKKKEPTIAATLFLNRVEVPGGVRQGKKKEGRTSSSHCHDLRKERKEKKKRRRKANPHFSETSRPRKKK